MIRLKAKAIAREQPEIGQNFTGSTTWLYRFMNRKKLSIRQKTKIAQRLPEEYEQEIVRFQRSIIQMRKCNGYELSQIGNMDETPMNFDMPATHTVHPTGEKTVIMKTTGNHFTVVLACMANGSKLKPMVIFKRKTMPKEPIPPQIVLHVHEKGWMDEAGMKLWIEKVWRCREGGAYEEKKFIGLYVQNTFDGVH